MITLSRPSPAEIDAYLKRVSGQSLSYAAVGAAREQPPLGFAVNHRRICLGRGEEVFQAACACLRRWEMVQVGWVTLCGAEGAPEPGAVVAVMARLGGAWWLNPCRIVYVEKPGAQARRYRFAYGTLADHLLQGEERFTVEWLDDDTVWYDLYAFARSRHWLARLGSPAVRLVQKHFAVCSMRAMARAVRRQTAALAAGEPG
jgi:uncharacterized protein (UPF0548 family)